MWRREREKEQKRKKLLVYFMAGIMVFSIFGVMFFGFRTETQKFNYNDFKFIVKGNVWVTNVDGREAIFSFFPADVENIEVDSIVINKIKDRLEIDVTSDVNDTAARSIALAQYQMDLTLQPVDIFVRRGFTTKNESILPVITCNDATQFIPVIYFKTSNKTRVSSKENCIIAEAQEPIDFIRIKDRLNYGLFGIIK